MKESPLFVKLFDFVAWVIPMTAKFPREQRFIVAEHLQQQVFAAHEAAIRAGMSTSLAATALQLDEVAVRLAQIRFSLRLAHKLTFITVKQYEYASERLTEIGRLLEAWRRTVQTKLAVPSASAP